MLSTPKHGWSEITIGNWSDRCSYLDDVPFDLLKAIKHLYETYYTPVCVCFDAEGYEYTIVFDLFYTHIISSKSDGEGFNYFSIDINIDDLAKELISDIRRDIDGWSKWLCYSDKPEDNIFERKRFLLNLCDSLERCIKRTKGDIIAEPEVDVWELLK